MPGPRRRAVAAGAALLIALAVPAALRAADDPLEAQVREIEAQVIAIRGIVPDAPVAWRVAPRETALADQLAALEEPDVLAETRAQEAVLTRLGLLAPGTDLVALLRETLAEQVAGYYDTDARRLTLVDADGVLDPLARVALAHEIGHALQDARWDLDALQAAIDPTDLDGGLAIRSLVEGDATLLMTLWTTAHAAAEVADAALGGGVGPEVALPMDAPPIIAETLLSPYLDGLGYLAQVWGPGGWAAVDARWEDPPRTMEEILHPGYSRADDPAIPVRLPDLAARLGPGWTVGAELTLGELVTAIWAADGETASVLPSFGRRVRPAAEVGAGWDGDRAVSLDGPDGAWLLAWQSTWERPEDADELIAAGEAALADHPDAWRIVPADLTGSGLPNPVLVLVASDPAVLDALDLPDGR